MRIKRLAGFDTKMVKSCCVYVCTYRAESIGKSEDTVSSVYRFPKRPEDSRRRAVKRKTGSLLSIEDTDNMQCTLCGRLV